MRYTLAMGEQSKPPGKPGPKKEEKVELPEDHDVVLLTGGRSEDGEGLTAIRSRPSRLEIAELRPMKAGKPLNGQELISLHHRQGSPMLWDVKVEHRGADGTAPHAGPARITTTSYRKGWDKVFAAGKKKRIRVKGGTGKAGLN